MKFTPTKFFVQILFGANVVSVILMLLTGFSYFIDPSKFSLVATLGMVYPFFLVVDVVFLFLWLLLKPMKAWLAFVALVVCYVPTHTYIGVNLPQPEPEIGMKVMSYNALYFNGYDRRFEADNNPVAHFLVDSDADIVCLQEADTAALADNMMRKLREKYPHIASLARRGCNNYVTICSKWPVVKSDTIPYESFANISAAFTVATPSGQILVVNNHFETNHLSAEERSAFRTMVKGKLPKEDVRRESQGLFLKLTEAALVRNAQAKAVEQYLKEHSDLPAIVCGDFNECPLSYTHHVVERNLTDCFVAKGSGLGFTYCHNGMRVRIDNIMCSSHFEPKSCKVLDNVDYSDHYPMVAWLQFNGNSAKGE